VDFPDPDPPAIPIINGFSIVLQSYDAGSWNALCRPDSRAPTFRRQVTMKKRSIVFALVVLGITACSGFSRGSASPQGGVTVLQVDNQGFLDMTVYALRSSQRVRLGSAAGNNKTNLTIPSDLVFGLTPLRFIADPIGGNRASVSQEITVAPGDTVVMTIPPQ
jgi:hypothetical protein